MPDDAKDPTAEFGFVPGWVDVPERQAMAATLPEFMKAVPLLMGSTPRDKPILLYKAWIDTGGYPPYYAQGPIGDCVGHSHAHANDLLQAVEYAMGKERSMITTLSEYVYAAARKKAGMLNSPDGAYCSAAVRAMIDGGMAARTWLGDSLPEVTYRPDRAKAWGHTGPPRDLELLARNFRLANAAKVSTWDEMVDALGNGFPVTEGSVFTPSGHRDTDGFCQPSSALGHAQFICGVRFDRPGACFFNSWPRGFYSGPLVLEQPEGSYWVDRMHVENILRAGDCWALSGSPVFRVDKPGALPGAWSR